ncbi:glycoside hydrolase [Alkalitalea saponilacus]|uniref:Glucuronoarabinoxylan endo-1,4-beta-xylanase n=1 Tax=Alkalitalea saponilacus TaxID=889453 RepID=A0A1T5AAT8_9BACT|nr:hypothetical protein [Alkalitalea saponilacus]ASB48764.1 secretion protein [Alkalitalea saponilacus]SKB32046.1 glucuronoarabinoxylan endo-1,4-beta-xylanase [Alkalitalea saponilacus]
MKKIYTLILLPVFILFLTAGGIYAQTATMVIDNSVQHQNITGFGGFVNGPQFQFNHMTTAQVQQLWGENSQMGYNIMRIYIPVGEENFPQAIPTAQLAQSLGVMLFASPWTMPPEWKTNNHINAVHNGIIGELKEEHYEDYANYLNNFVELMRENGVELAAISIQNEPDYLPGYHGCRWSPEQMANFIRDYGHIITAPIMAAEGIGITDNYANAMLPDEVFNNLGIFAGHQYGPIQTAHKKLQEKGMEVWQSEFLINWNADLPSDRNFTWSIDAFDFAMAVNTALLSDINAWVHYASKRYYGMMGDGTNGTPYGVITKRGYILSHFAQYTTGTTRVESSWRGGSDILDGSAYLSASGDEVIVKVINPSDDPYTLTIDLPFYTNMATSITTTINANMVESTIDIPEETFRPRIDIAASSFTTLIFSIGDDRPESEMEGVQIFPNAIENQFVTNPSFGTDYQMSGQTFIFDNGNHLISPNTNSSNGYLQLDDRYNKLVFHIKEISSPATYTSANTTLYYINRNGQVRSHNYGTISFNQQGNYNWVLDISTDVLTDGITGVIGLRNGNWTSVLSITFGDVYFMIGDEKMYKFSGAYSSGDGFLLDCLEDMTTTSIDFSEVTGIPAGTDWHSMAVNKNAVYYVGEEQGVSAANLISDNISEELILSDVGGSFYIHEDITVGSASYTIQLNGYRIISLPFDANIPEDIGVYTLEYESGHIYGYRVENGGIYANTPVLVVGNGTFTFIGNGLVSTQQQSLVDDMTNVYVSVRAPRNSYVLKNVGGIYSFHRVQSGEQHIIMPFSAYFEFDGSVTAANLPLVLDDVSNINDMPEFQDWNDGDNVYYDLLGRPVRNPQKGVIYIKNGKKVIYQ